MIASGAIPASYTVVPETGEVITPDEEPDPPISQEQRQSLFRMAKEHLGGDANKILKEMVEQHGYESRMGCLCLSTIRWSAKSCVWLKRSGQSRPALNLCRKMVVARKSLPSNGS